MRFQHQTNPLPPSPAVGLKANISSEGSQNAQDGIHKDPRVEEDDFLGDPGVGFVFQTQKQRCPGGAKLDGANKFLGKRGPFGRK